MTLTNFAHENCHIGLLLAKLVPSIDKSILTCIDSSDLSEVETNLNNFFDKNIRPLLTNELSPYIAGQKWLTTYLPNPRDDGY